MYSNGKKDGLCFNCLKLAPYKYQCSLPKNKEIKLKAVEMSKQYGFKKEISNIHLAELIDSGQYECIILEIFVTERCNDLPNLINQEPIQQQDRPTSSHPNQEI